jgi:hypothetical protein
VRLPFIAGLFLSGTLAAFQFIFSDTVAYKKVESPDLLPTVDYSNVPLAVLLMPGILSPFFLITSVLIVKRSISFLKRQ